MTGWRLGWSVWPQNLYDLARKLAVNAHSCVNAATQWAGIAALDGPQIAWRRWWRNSTSAGMWWSRG